MIFRDRVKVEVSASGTGDVALSGATAPAGYVTWGASFPASVSSPTGYGIVDPNTGAWETGYGHFDAATNTLSRTAVHSNSAGTAAKIDFGVGLKEVFCTYTGAMAAAGVTPVWKPVILSASATYYIRTDGNDANSGTLNTSGGAWATIQHAIDWISDNVNANGYSIKIGLGVGTYSVPYTEIYNKGFLNCPALTIGGFSPSQRDTIILNLTEGPINWGPTSNTTLRLEFMTVDAGGSWTALEVYGWDTPEGYFNDLYLRGLRIRNFTSNMVWPEAVRYIQIYDVYFGTAVLDSDFGSALWFYSGPCRVDIYSLHHETGNITFSPYGAIGATELVDILLAGSTPITKGSVTSAGPRFALSAGSRIISKAGAAQNVAIQIGDADGTADSSSGYY